MLGATATLFRTTQRASRGPPMANAALANYLNDHLAASVAALDLMAFLRDRCADAEMAVAVAAIRTGVLEDRKTLLAVMRAQGIRRPPVRIAAAWVAAKLGQLRFRSGGTPLDGLRLLQGIELISLGIEGKTALWRALAETARTAPELAWPDFDALIAGSEGHRQAAEALRLRAARAAFAEP